MRAHRHNNVFVCNEHRSFILRIKKVVTFITDLYVITLRVVSFLFFSFLSRRNPRDGFIILSLTHGRQLFEKCCSCADLELVN